jgi:GT2 family glycosyltransferase
MTPDDVTVAIPTYKREEVLVATLEALLAQEGRPDLLVVDQTTEHEPATRERLESLDRGGHIRWVRLSEPSIPKAMNLALLQATRPLILFLDDDIRPAPGLVAAHAESYTEASTWAVSGQILQPGQEPDPGHRRFRTSGLRAFLEFPFNSTEPAWVANVMAGNLSVRRRQALEVGGFDENFVGAAFRFETEFCRRLGSAGGRILFQPRARIHHLRAERGGTRSYGSHLTSFSPAHSVGDYYFALRHGLTLESVGYILWRPIRHVRTRFHLRRPWWIVPKLVGEARALVWAVRLARRGPRYVPAPSSRVTAA